MIKFNLKNLRNNILIIIFGAISSFSLPPYNFFVINFLVFPAFFIFLIKMHESKKSKLQFFKVGWLFGFGYFLSNLYWISFSLNFDENFKFLIPLTILFIPAFLSLFYGFAIFVFSFFISDKKLISSILSFSLFISVFEFIRGYIFSGFPWNLIAYSFSNQLEFIQISSLIGIYSFNLILITFFTVPSILILKKNRKQIYVLFFFILLGITFLFYGNNKINNFDKIETKKNNYKIVLVSSQIPLNRFYENINEEKILDELIRLSKPKINQKTLFIWPEGILPNLDATSINKYKYKFNNNFGDNHKILLGINKTEIIDGKEKYYNSMIVIDKHTNIESIYKKNKLVPFGEFLPFEKTLKKFGLKSLTNNYNSYTKGRDRKIITIFNSLDYINLLPLICYEIIYSGYLSELNDFDYIVNISEDGWFGDSIGPYQHFAHTIFRSIESGKYTLRSTNNGISAIVNPLGKVLNQIPIGFKGSIVLDTSKKTTDTLFSRLGNKMFIIVIFIYIFLIFSFNKLKNE